MSHFWVGFEKQANEEYEPEDKLKAALRSAAYSAPIAAYLAMSDKYPKLQPKDTWSARINRGAKGKINLPKLLSTLAVGATSGLARSYIRDEIKRGDDPSKKRVAMLGLAGSAPSMLYGVATRDPNEVISSGLWGAGEGVATRWWENRKKEKAKSDDK